MHGLIAAEHTRERDLGRSYDAISFEGDGAQVRDDGFARRGYPTRRRTTEFRDASTAKENVFKRKSEHLRVRVGVGVARGRDVAAN